jgi:hypothetical protein
MKSRDEIERQLCQIILSACQVEQDSGNGFMVPSAPCPTCYHLSGSQRTWHGTRRA